MKTYGRLRKATNRDHPKFGSWVVSDLQPHVATAFKRLFPRVRAEDVEHALSDTDDIRADLLWFMARYPLETTHEQELVAGDSRVKARIAERDRILETTWEPPEVLGFRPGKKPYVYQVQAAQICLNMGGLLLGDEVGLGKTITAATLLVMGAPLPAGVVVQPHLADQWEKRIREFTTLRTHIIAGTQPYNLPPADVYIFRYSNIGGWIDFLKNGLLKTVVYDEIQELRHGTDTAKGRVCSIVSDRAKMVLGLTATPIYNYGDEMHTVLSYIAKDLLGTRDEFLREWTGYGKVVKDPDALGSYLRETGWFLRRDEDDPAVQQSMPRPNVIDVKVAWDDGAVADEAALTRALAMSVMNGSFVEAGRASRELDLKMRHMTGVAKARSVAAYVRMLLRGGAERVLLAGWHRDVYATWRKALADYEPVLYTGSETAAQKGFSFDAFTQGNSRVMMISLRSGAGLDGLQFHCKDVVFGELDWSPQVHHQVIGRLRRPGQLEQVNAHYLYTDDGSDPVLIETLGVKSDQARGVNAPGEAPKAKVRDDSRIKRLAQFVLDKADDAPEPCELCERPSTGKPSYVIPIEKAELYPAGPERDALFEPGNVWFLCADCRDQEDAAA